MDAEIAKILSNIKHKEIRTLDEIREINAIAIDEAYIEFIDFEQNHKNKEQVINKLDMYEFIEYEFLNVGDYIRFFDKQFFFNMKLDNGGRILSIRKDKLLIWGINKRRKWVKFDNFIFRKLDEEDFAKIKLIELIGSNI